MVFLRSLVLFIVLATALSSAVGSVSQPYTNGAYHGHYPVHGLLGYAPLNMTFRDPGVINSSYYSFSAVRCLPPPNETPITVTVVENQTFPFNPKDPAQLYNATVRIPKGNFSFALLNVSVEELNGTQFDRQFDIFLNGVPVLWGSTQEVRNSTTTVGLTEFLNMLHGNVTFQFFLPAYQSKSLNITGIYTVTANLLLYNGTAPAYIPNYMIPLDNRSPIFRLSPSSDVFSTSLSLPQGSYREQMVMYTEGGGLDEFWYANEPATRSLLVYYDGRLADVINPFPTVYTGGIDLFWWKPVPSINTLAVHYPYVAELTPLLALGNEVNLSVSMTNLVQASQLTGSPAFDWSVSGYLMVWANTSNPLVSGQMLLQSQEFIDSSPFLNPSMAGIIYQEYGHYRILYSSELEFQHGKEYAYSFQEGSFSAYQVLNQIGESFNLNQQSYEKAFTRGLLNSSLTVSTTSPVSGEISVFVLPLSNPALIPFNVSEVLNGTFRESYTVNYSSTFNGMKEYSGLRDSEYAEGGFGLTAEVINAQGGAVVIGVSQNYASTVKVTDLVFSSPLYGFTERAVIHGISPNAKDPDGYYIQDYFLYKYG